MKRGIDNGLLITDFDQNHFRILNPGVVHSPSLIETDDPRLSDPREPIDGSVTDESVSDDAAIEQSKLTLNGNIPVNWFGTESTDVARADLAENRVHRDALNGYPSLGLNGKMLPGTTPTSGTGTLKIINFDFPVGELTLDPVSSTTTRSFINYWAAQDAGTWFGNVSGATARPVFTSAGLSVDMIPGFDASRIVSGTFNVEQLPVAQGIGAGHSAGLVPAPGSPALNSTAQSTDYLARDMTYKPMKPLVSYQPQLPMPSITVQSYYQGQAYVNITDPVLDANLFYSLGSGEFTEIITLGDRPTLPILVPVGAVVNAYAAKIGYNNSEIAFYTIPPTPSV